MPCASGERGLNGELCPYVTHTLETAEGYEAWDVILRCDTQLRVVPSGNVLGFDLPAFITVAEALGYSLQAFVSLIGSAEAGMLQGIKEMQHANT